MRSANSGLNRSPSLSTAAVRGPISPPEAVTSSSSAFESVKRTSPRVAWKSDCEAVADSITGPGGGSGAGGIPNVIG